MLHTVNDIAAAFHLNQRETFCARRLFNVHKFLLCSLKGPLISAEAPECSKQYMEAFRFSIEFRSQFEDDCRHNIFPLILTRNGIEPLT